MDILSNEPGRLVKGPWAKTPPARASAAITPVLPNGSADQNFVPLLRDSAYRCQTFLTLIKPSIKDMHLK